MNSITWWEALALGLVQGFTEFLPISSSGHLAVAQTLFGFQESLLFFDVVLHLGTLIAVFVYFWSDLRQITTQQIRMVLLGSLPLIGIVFFFRDQVELLFSNIALVVGGLLITGVVNIWSDKMLDTHDEVEVVTKEEVGWKEALLVGVAQLISVVPGISRSGATVFAGLFGKLNRYTAFRYSFFLSIPAVGGATFLQATQLETWNSVAWLPVIIGAIAALLSGLLSLRLLEYLIVSARLKIFGWYCFAFALLVSGWAVFVQ